MRANGLQASLSSLLSRIREKQHGFSKEKDNRRKNSGEENRFRVQVPFSIVFLVAFGVGMSPLEGASHFQAWETLTECFFPRERLRPQRTWPGLQTCGHHHLEYLVGFPKTGS